MFAWLIVIAGVAAIVWVNWYFLFAPKAEAKAQASAAGLQTVDITVNGGYTPSVVRVEKGKPARLIFDRREKSPCSEELIISDFGIRRFLRPFEKTSVEFTPAEAGSYEFTCGMNMMRGRIVVEE